MKLTKGLIAYFIHPLQGQQKLSYHNSEILLGVFQDNNTKWDQKKFFMVRKSYMTNFKYRLSSILLKLKREREG